MDDISEWLEPLAALKRTNPDAHLNTLAGTDTSSDLPFLRNQSVEGLETHHKQQNPLPFCRHISIPDNCEPLDNPDDSSSSDEDLSDISDWYKNISAYGMDPEPKGVFAGIVKKSETLLAKKSSYDVSDVVLRNPECLNAERKIPEVDYRRYNIDQITQNPMMAEGVKNVARIAEKEKTTEKAGFFAKKLLSPKLSRLFKPHTAEVVRNRPETDGKEEKSKSKFFIQKPTSPCTGRSSYRVRPLEQDKPKNSDCDVIESDLKLARLGKPMTPIFRRHIPTDRPEHADGRYSYRDKRPKRYEPKTEPKFVDVGRNRIKAPVTLDEGRLSSVHSSQLSATPALGVVVGEKKNSDTINSGQPKKREPGISRSNYVSLANLKINSKAKKLEENEKISPEISESCPVERVI